MFASSAKLHCPITITRLGRNRHISRFHSICHINCNEYFSLEPPRGLGPLGCSSDCYKWGFPMALVICLLQPPLPLKACHLLLQMICFVALLHWPDVKDLRWMHRAIVQNQRSAPPRRDCCVARSGALFPVRLLDVRGVRRAATRRIRF